jgi:hypothetical protein
MWATARTVGSSNPLYKINFVPADGVRPREPRIHKNEVPETSAQTVTPSANYVMLAGTHRDERIARRVGDAALGVKTI